MYLICGNLRIIRKLIEVKMQYNTKQRGVLIDFFESRHDQSFSAEEIVNQLKNDTISISAVYRNLTDLEKDGKIKKIAKSGTRKAFYQFVDCDECKGHLHLTCTICGKTEHLDDGNSHQIAKAVLQNSNFNLDSASTVLYGICGKCHK